MYHMWQVHWETALLHCRRFSMEFYYKRIKAHAHAIEIENMSTADQCSVECIHKTWRGSNNKLNENKNSCDVNPIYFPAPRLLTAAAGCFLGLLALHNTFLNLNCEWQKRAKHDKLQSMTPLTQIPAVLIRTLHLEIGSYCDQGDGFTPGEALPQDPVAALILTS